MYLNKKNFLFLVLFLIFLWIIFACEESKRDIIEFSDPIAEVTDSIRAMNSYLSNISLNEEEAMSYYFDYERYFYINSNKLFHVSDTFQNTKDLDILIQKNNLNNIQAKIFKNSFFLLKNHLDGCYQNQRSGDFYYNYRRSEKNELDDLRVIILKKGSVNFSTERNHINIEVLDTKGDLVLIRYLK